MSLRKKPTTPPNPEAFELGFGTKFIGGKSKIIKADGQFNILRKGVEKETFYEHMIRLPWPLFIIELLAIFIIVNAFYATIFCFMGPSAMYGIDEGTLIQKFQASFFFSVHTFTTVGYGNVYPIGFWANLVVILDAFSGLLMVAVATGLLFLRFSKAKVKIKFSKNMLLTPHKNLNSLQFRIVNASNTTLMNVEASITATWLDQNGMDYKRRFQRLNLDLSHLYLLPLNWTVVHLINEESPLYEKSADLLAKNMMEFIVMIKAFDPQYNQHIFKNYSYDYSSIKEGAKFKLMYHSTDEMTILDIHELDSYTDLQMELP